jgi:hypothetical protein
MLQPNKHGHPLSAVFTADAASSVSWKPATRLAHDAPVSYAVGTPFSHYLHPDPLNFIHWTVRWPVVVYRRRRTAGNAIDGCRTKPKVA